MKVLKKAVALMLCLVMTIGVFAVSGITVDDLAGLFTKAEAYTNTTICFNGKNFSITVFNNCGAFSLNKLKLIVCIKIKLTKINNRTKSFCLFPFNFNGIYIKNLFCA